MKELILIKMEKYRELDGNNDLHLIGKTIKFKSPITCAGKTGICPTCYGKKLFQINKDYYPGIIATLLITNQFTQNLLSSKHLLKVSVDELDWSNFMNSIF